MQGLQQELPAEGAAARADWLAAGGAVGSAVELLVAAEDPAGAGQLLDRHVTALVARGQVDEVLAAVAAVPPVHRSLLARVAEADVQVLLRTADVVELRALDDEAARTPAAATPAGADVAALRWWIASLRAQCLLTQQDVLGAVAATAVLAEIPDDPFLPDIVLQARGRLRLTAAVGQLLSGPGSLGLATGSLAGALSDFERAGWLMARALAVSAFYFFHVTIAGVVSPEVQAAVCEARDQLEALGSPQRPLAQLVTGLVAYARRDLATAEPALQAAAGGTGPFGYVGLLAEHTLLLVALRRAAHPRPLLVPIDDNLADLRRAFPAGIANPLRRTAEAALDVGLVDVAAAYLGRLAATPALPAGYEQAEREILRHRVALAGGDRSAAGPLEAAVEALGADGRRDAASARARWAAADAELAGLGDLASRFGRLADDLGRGESASPGRPGVPADGQSGDRPARRRLAVVPAAGDSPPSVAPVAAARHEGRIKVLSPSLVVTVAGRLRHVAANVGRLLVTMAVRPGPLAAEELCGLLWPEAEEDVGRARLKTAVYRLRRQLGLAADELIVRGPGTVTFVPGINWTVDLHDFWRLVAGSGEQRIEAWRLVNGAVCDAQFPYDEVVSEERQVVLARWTRLTEELTAAGLVDEAEAELRSRRLGLAV